MKKKFGLATFAALLVLSSCSSGQSEEKSSEEARLLISESSLTLSEEKTHQLSAKPSQEIEGEIVWSVKDVSIASVSGSGLVTALKQGNTQIYATLSNLVAVCSLTVTSFEPDKALSLSLSQTSFTVSLDAENALLLPVEVRYGEEKIEEYDLEATVKDPSIASIEKGCLRGLKKGSTTAKLKASYLSLFDERIISIEVR